MKIILEKRAQQSKIMAYASPVLAIGLTVILGGIIFALAGYDPQTALYYYFVEPLTNFWSIEEVIVKATPLILIGAGLAICFSANIWNIGAEGQLTMGALVGSFIPVMFTDWQSPLVLLLMLVMGAMGGAAWAGLVAFLKNKFNVNEILTSLMLVYVAQYILDWFVRGPWRDPNGYNFPKSVSFEGWQLLPTYGDGRMHIGALIALIVVVLLTIMMTRSLKGFEIRAIGNSRRAGAFAGFSYKGMTWFCFLLSGALAGLAGIMEVAGPAGQLLPSISPGYGFTAIIVAFLGRLNPMGVLLAGILLAISYLGGDGAQMELGVSVKTAQVFQGMLLFLILTFDTLIRYKVKIIRSQTAEGELT
ncbi:MAG: ABC transporter permease [Rhizobiales bacterium]|nr:ABC transporter permease [Hyphomicrobiales bacterium]NRB14548.1 ABC transporter permease [Hyphomicrobiales bacterium]